MELKTKQVLAQAAETLAKSFQLVQYETTTYMPMHWASKTHVPGTPENEQIWEPLSRRDIRYLANVKSNILFATDSELSSFDYMLQQWSKQHFTPPQSILVKHESGLKQLDSEGNLTDPTGEFTPNYLPVEINDNPEDKAEVREILNGWLESEEVAESLLHHLATALAPGYAAVKYVMLLGDGRNGKGVLLSMLAKMFGDANTSNINRQQIADQLAVCTELNGKLINLVFDGQQGYVKDSGLEKTLIAGEPGYIRRLYESSTTKVQTNALFVEALNKEPKTRDKSSALQKRIARFHFPKIFEKDIAFETKMTSDRMVGALLSLMIDHYVKKDELAEKLKLSQSSSDLQMFQMWANSPVMQFIEHVIQQDPKIVDKLLQHEVDPLINSFMAWRISEGYGEYSSADALVLFRDCFNIEWRSARVNGKVTKVKKITQIKPETQLLIDNLKGDDSGTTPDGALVEDG